MIARTISATEAKNRFGAVLREVKKTGGPIMVQKDGKTVAIIMSVNEYEIVQKNKVIKEPAPLELAAFGMWADRDDMDETWLEEGRAQWRSSWHEQ